MKRVFVTGISTEVGKTVTAAVLTEALEADYWKPVQAGDLEDSDSHTVEALISNPKSTIHPNSYALKTPMSPHAAASIDGVQIRLSEIQSPKTDNYLVVEGAGGLLVPLNEENTIEDLILPGDKVVVVSRHYLGSINHTLLTVDRLLSQDRDLGLLFIGNEHPTTESIIRTKTGVPILGRIPIEAVIDKSTVKRLAQELEGSLMAWLA